MVQTYSGMFRNPAQPGELLWINNKIYVCVACDFVPAPKDIEQFNDGYGILYRDPTPEEQQTAEYQRLQQRINKEHAEKEEQERINAAKPIERANRNKWIEENLRDLEEVNFWPNSPLAGLPVEEHITFATGTFGTGDKFCRYTTYQGQTIWAHYYGNASIYYVPQDLANTIHQEEWEDRSQTFGTGYLMLSALQRNLENFSTLGSDLYQWAINTFGEDQLIQLAQANAPIDVKKSNHCEAWVIDPDTMLFN